MTDPPFELRDTTGTGDVPPLLAKGEIRVLRQRKASDLLSGEYRFYDNTTRLGSIPLARAMEKMERYKSHVPFLLSDKVKVKVPAWMHICKELPKDVIKIIHEFASPPPVLFLEEGDLVMTFDWSPVLGSPADDDLSDFGDSLTSESWSMLVARPRLV